MYRNKYTRTYNISIDDDNLKISVGFTLHHTLNLDSRLIIIFFGYTYNMWNIDDIVTWVTVINKFSPIFIEKKLMKCYDMKIVLKLTHKYSLHLTITSVILRTNYNQFHF